MFTMGATNASWPVPCPGGVPAWPSSFNCSAAAGCKGQPVRGHSAPTAYGPWTPILGPGGGEVLWTAVNPDPSPTVLPNGTVCVVGGGIRCAADWRGPYLEVPGPKFADARHNYSGDPRLYGGDTRHPSQPKLHHSSGWLCRHRCTHNGCFQLSPPPF